MYVTHTCLFLRPASKVEPCGLVNQELEVQAVALRALQGGDDAVTFRRFAFIYRPPARRL
jgi:hypothetical protein